MMTSFILNKLAGALRGSPVQGLTGWQTWHRSVGSALKQPACIVSLLLAAFETLPTIYYGRFLAALDPVTATFSTALSFIGTAATYLLIIRLVSSLRWLKHLIVVLIAMTTLALQVIFFGIYREFATLPTVSIVDFARQTPEYAWALFRARLDVLSIGAASLGIYAMSRALNRGFVSTLQFGALPSVALGLIAIASFMAAQEPFLSVSQQAAWLITKSSHGPGVVNRAWTPERALPPKHPAQHPVNIMIIRLEEVAARATTLERPELPTMPLLTKFAGDHPDEVFVSHRHFANSTATDVSVLSIYTGLSPAAELETHRHIPILWDYFAAAGYDTSLFIPYHLEWGDFKRRFNARPGELNLNKLVDAGNSGLPIVYDNSINDTDVVSEALAYQQKRGWAEPFLQIVSLKMPHAIGEGARINKLSYGTWDNEPKHLHDYYNGIRHNDILIDEFIGAIPAETKARTVFVFLSDHGTRLFTRTDGAQELHRLDNYHQETTRVPFLVYVPLEVQRKIPAEKIENLRTNLATHATSNIDMVPTLLGLAGIPAVNVDASHPEWLVGRDLTQAHRSTEVIVQMNTGALRRWDREHFGLVVGDGNYHYMFSMGRELLYDLHADPEEKMNLIDEATYSAVVSRAHAIATQVPELLRIQQKYKQNLPTEEELTVAQSPIQPSWLQVRVAPADVMRVPSTKGGAEMLLAEYELAPPTSGKVVRSQFDVRVQKDAGRIEWRLKAAPNVKHFVHVDTLRAGDVHRFEFRWRPESKDASPLSVQLFGIAERGEFALRLEKSEAQLAEAKMTEELELVTLARQPPGQAIGVYRLDRFKEHACLSQPDSTDCPNGYLVWGPYVKGVKGADVQLRYDIDADSAGAKVWFDLAARGGSERLARTRIFRIAEAGSHSFELSARLASDAEGIEGRLNANGGQSMKGYTIAVRHAELTLAKPTAP